MTEIEKYLMEKEQNTRRKILIVDDSITVRQRIKRLMAKDYDVSEVGSGISAFRSITLDRPDLICWIMKCRRKTGRRCWKTAQ